MMFTKRLREPVCAARSPAACASGKSRTSRSVAVTLGPGAIHVTSIRQIDLADVTPALARRSGFEGLVNLLKVAKHGPGENVYLVEFEYEEG